MDQQTPETANSPTRAEATSAWVEEAEDLLWRAAVLETYAERLVAQSADLENEGLERVASYERQRRVVLEAQVRLHGAEMRGTEPALLGLADSFLHEEERKRWIWRQAESCWEQSRRCLARAQAKSDRAQYLRRRAEELMVMLQPGGAPGDGAAVLALSSAA